MLNSSIKENNWELAKVDERIVNTICQHHNLPEMLARILANRNVLLEDIPNFLDPKIRDFLPNPFIFLDMEKASMRLIAAIKNKEKVVVYGDYDVDGATSSALLARYFKQVGLEIEIYIPDRILEGYGPNSPAMQKFKDQNIQIVITVDSGTTAFEPLEFAAKLGLEVIVVDHHMANDTLPHAFAIINPNRLDEKQGHGHLAAVGVCFLLIVAINSLLRKDGFFSTVKEPDLIKLLDIVALGTVCDVVPLLGINRAFVKQGLKVMQNRENIGLKTLSDIAGIRELATTYHLGYIIGPRINAGGRVGTSYFGSKLLASHDEDEVHDLARRLDQFNLERKSIEKQALEEALIQAESKCSHLSTIFVAADNWHPGVIGIIAGRLKDAFNKPTAVISLNHGIGKASCRSIPGFDFGAAVIRAKTLDIIEYGGGHKMAAGFTIKQDRMQDFQDFLNDECKKYIDVNEKETKYFDAYISVQAVTLELTDLIEKAGPYGASSLEPKFAIANAFIAKSNIVGIDHVSCFIGSADNSCGTLLKATAFRAVDNHIGDFLLNKKGANATIIGYVKVNEWRGRRTAEFLIEDIII